MRFLRRLSPFFLVLLVIEFLDELVYSSHEAAWPLIRADLHLSYTQIGLLLSIPAVFAVVIESVIGILGDTPLRRNLIRGGGVFFVLAALFTGLSRNFTALAAALVIGYPASGAFVSLSQAALMDADPDRREHNMARWTFAGSLGVVAGPLLLGVAAAVSAGWRGLFIFLAALSLVILLVAWRMPKLGMILPHPPQPGPPRTSLAEGLKRAGQTLKRKDVLRWLVLLEFSDLMLDVFYGYLALYFVDVGGLSPLAAGLAVGVWTGSGLAGDFLLIPLLERVRGLAYLRISIWAELLLFPAFLLTPWLPAKLVLVGLLGLFNSGWYAILQGRLYASVPGQSGTVITLSNVSGLFGKLIPLAIGIAAERFGLGAAIWLLLLGPIALLVGVPRPESQLVN
jgi:FSR family fosmidomycin resistance protein-like MFS transporter